MKLLASTFVRTSLLFLVAGFGLGGWMMAAPGFQLPIPKGMYSVHVHFLTVGFMTGMVMGVAIWMFPAPQGQGRKGIEAREPWGWAAYGLLVGGLLLRAVVEFIPNARTYQAGAVAFAVSALLQVGGSLAFAVAIWARTRVFRTVQATATKKE